MLKAHVFLQAQGLLAQGDPAAAVSEARRVRNESPGPVADWGLAAILIDASDLAGKLSLALEGKAILERLPEKMIAANEAHYHYNLGNAFACIGRHQRGIGAARRPAMAEAVSHYDQAVQISDFADVRANLANALLAQGRYIEAADELEVILEAHPSHYNALGFRGSALIGINGWLNSSHAGLLQAALGSYRNAVKSAEHDPVVARQFAACARRLEHHGVPDLSKVDKKPMRADAKWIWANRLALNPCPICRLDSPNAFDLYPMAGVLVSPRRRPPARDLFVALNAVLATYGTARWQLWSAENPGTMLPDDHIIQHTGSSGSLIDLRLGLRMAALVGFYRVLGQIASVLNSCLHLKHTPERVTFDNVWGKPASRGLPKTLAQLHPSIRARGNAPLSALYYLAGSLELGLGRYADLRILRNQIEHRVAAPVVGARASKAARYYEPFVATELAKNVYKLGRIARAGIWYMCAALMVEEHRRIRAARKSGRVVVRGKGTPVARR